MKSLVVLGRQPALGMAELERLYGAPALQPFGPQLALLDVAPDAVEFIRLGGSVKLAKVLTSLEARNLADAVRYITKTVPEHLQHIPEGKIRLGLNVYGLPVSVNDLNKAGLQIKTAIKRAGRSVRVVPNTALELSSAQTLHNQLTGPTGLEFIIAKHGNQVLLAQVVASQNINAYAARDQARPKRDARVGMLPPKLAQIIVNLAHPGEGETVLDPFCGTGVVLQEALLMGRYVYGTDLEPRMIDYTRENLRWLVGPTEYPLEVGDATNYHWAQPFDVVAGETYLGRPFSTEPDATTLGQVMRDVDTIHRKFLKNLAQQTEQGFTACLAVPAWITKNGIKHLKMLDSLEELGYTRMSFVHASNEDLVYYREGQVVGRELVVITRK